MTQQRRAPEGEFLRVGIALAILLHAGVALAFLLLPHEPPRTRRIVEFAVRKKVPPPVKAPEPPKPEEPPEPEKKIIKKAERPREAPRPTRQAPTDEPPRPVFGVKTDDLKGPGIALPEGNTTMQDPKDRPKGPVAPLPPASAPAGKEYRPIGESELKRLPDHDVEECGDSMKQAYSGSQAYTEGIEGEVVFRIELDERGKIHSVKKVKGLGHGLDEMAMGFLRFNAKCRFGPALGKDGKPAAYVIERYSVRFEAPR